MSLSKDEEEELLSKLEKADAEQVRRVKEKVGSYEAADRIFEQLKNLRDDDECPDCGKNGDVIKHGCTEQNKQRYRCKGCGQTFIEKQQMPFHHSEHSIQKWKSFLTAMISGSTLEDLAEAHDLNLKTAFNWRHDILDAIYKLQQDTWLAGRVWADEAFFNMNEPGRGREGIVSKKMAVLTGQDYQERTFAVPVSPGQGSSTEAIESTLEKYLVEGSSTLVTDNARNFAEYCREHDVEHEAHDSKSDNMNMINWLHSHSKNWYKQFRGVGADYLKNYCAWFAFLKNNPSIKTASIGK